MTQRKYAVLIAVAMFVAAGSLSGCGSSSTNSASIEQNRVAKASVTISAKFPTAGGAVKSLLPAGAQVIEVYAQVWPHTFNNYTSANYNPNGTLIATLSPAQPSATVQITPGMYMVYATAYDSANTMTRRELGRTSTGGEIKSGQANTIVLTFLDGQWTLVNASDVPTPLELSDGTKLNDFVVSAEMQQPMYKAGKSLIDYSKPMGGGGGTVRLRFNNNTSARTYGGMVSQFVGTANSTNIGVSEYNLTKKCSFDKYYNIPCEETAGDQIVMISGKDTSSGSQSGGPYAGETLLLSGSAETLLPGGGQTTFTQNGAALDLMSVLPDSVVTSGNIITGGVIEWKPDTTRTTTLGTPATAKLVKSAKTVKLQSNNTAYTGLTIKDVQTIVCSGTDPQKRGTWTFANNTSAGKVVLGSRVCYTNYPSVNSYDPITYFPVTPNAGDYSYGLVPTNTANLGDYCHVWDSNPNTYDYTGPFPVMIPNPGYNTCKQIEPGAGDVYNPYYFRALKSTTKTTISYGSFKFNFWGEQIQTGTAYVYPFRAKGSTTITPAQ